MAWTLVAVVLVLVLGHVAPALTQLRGYTWFIEWLRILGRANSGQAVWQGRLGLLLAIGLPVVAVGAVQFLLRNHFYGLPGFGFALLALAYAWGPRDLDLDVDAVRWRFVLLKLGLELEEKCPARAIDHMGCD